MAQHRYIETFGNWKKLNENGGEEQQVSDQADELIREFSAAAETGRITTSELMKWFRGMMELYDSTELKGLIFKKMKSIWARYFKIIYPVLNMDNKELTSSDIAIIKRYKQLSSDESRHEKSADDLLRELGLL